MEVLLNVLFNFFLTALVYLAVPIIVALTQKNLSLKKIKRITILNAIVMWIIVSILLMESIGETAGMSIILWSYIGQKIMKWKCYSEEKNIEEKAIEEQARAGEPPSIEHQNFPQYVYVEPELDKREPIVMYTGQLSSDAPQIDVQKPIIFQHTETLKEKKTINRRNIILTTLSLLLVISLGLNVYQYVSSKETTGNHNDSSKIKISIATYNELMDCKKEVSLNKEKLQFFDDNVVFVIEGHGNYYFTYDQMIGETHDDDEYYYWAYNIDQAISLGYKPAY